MQVLDTSPGRVTFQRARRIAMHYRLPLTLVFGFNPACATTADSDDTLHNYGIQCILFQPMTGANCRVHFGWDDRRRVRIRYGEFGDV